MMIILVCLIGFCCAQSQSLNKRTEPSCYTSNRFEYEFGVLEKLESLQRDKNELLANVKSLTALVDQLARKTDEDKLMIQNLTDTVNSIKGLKDPGGDTYIRWGRTECPIDTDAELVYNGFAGGAPHDKHGNGANYLCLPKDPQWGPDTTPSYKGDVHGAEYQVHGTFWDHLKDNDVPCAVCRTSKTNVLMIPARQECYEGWNKEYHGYLMAERDTHQSNKEYICMDGEPEARIGTQANVNGALLHFQQAVCGSLPCLPYIGGRELTCVVCTYESL
ncbi:uncharacterized protein LOC128234084 [Mya arenaria]|nr:uncharacterized protein LOC128234084 [Mya arenaria]